MKGNRGWGKPKHKLPRDMTDAEVAERLGVDSAAALSGRGVYPASPPVLAAAEPAPDPVAGESEEAIGEAT